MRRTWSICSRTCGWLALRKSRWLSTMTAGSAGEVLAVSKGMAHVSGVPTAAIGSLLDIACRDGRSRQALVIGVGRRDVWTALMGPADTVHPKDMVTHTGEVPTFPVGPSILGRVLNPLGQPLDGGPPIAAAERLPVLSENSPSIVERSPCTVGMQLPARHPHDQLSRPQTFLPTGIKLMDLLHPLTRGLRYAVLGPRHVGKSLLATEVLANQALTTDSLPTASPEGQGAGAGAGLEGAITGSSGLANDVPVCIYACVGKSKAECERTVAWLAEKGALRYTAVIFSPNTDPLPLQYLAPFSASSAAGWFRDRGQHALVVYDDLSAHGDAYLNMARSCPYPLHHLSYVHARLLERSAQLAPELGGGSSTALCLLETQNVDRLRPGQVNTQPGGSLSADVVETVAGYADHCIHLDGKLTLARLWPPLPLDAAASASHGQGLGLLQAAPRFQPRVIRRLVTALRYHLLDSAQAQAARAQAAELGLDPEEEDIPVIDFARRAQLLLAQPQGAVLPLPYQLVTLTAALDNLLVDVPERELASGAFEWRMHRFLEDFAPELLADMAALEWEDELPESIETALKHFYAEFKQFDRDRQAIL